MHYSPRSPCRGRWVRSRRGPPASSPASCRWAIQFLVVRCIMLRVLHVEDDGFDRGEARPNRLRLLADALQGHLLEGDPNPIKFGDLLPRVPFNQRALSRRSLDKALLGQEVEGFPDGGAARFGPVGQRERQR